MPGQHDDCGAEADAAGAASEIGEQLRRRRRHRVAGEVVFEREQRVEAQGLGEIADRQMLADDGYVRAPGLAQHVERGPDLHGNPPSPSLPACSADRSAPSTKPRESPKAAGRLRPLSRAGRACTFGPSAGVAEWQTRQTQNLLPVREWGFKSLHPHQPEPVMALDTLSYARRLKASGFSDQQAETLADATKELVADQMVTKDFLASEMDKLSMRLTIRMGTIAVVVVGALAAIIKL